MRVPCTRPNQSSACRQSACNSSQRAVVGGLCGNGPLQVCKRFLIIPLRIRVPGNDAKRVTDEDQQGEHGRRQERMAPCFAPQAPEVRRSRRRLLTALFLSQNGVHEKRLSGTRIIAPLLLESPSARFATGIRQLPSSAGTRAKLRGSG